MAATWPSRAPSTFTGSLSPGASAVFYDAGNAADDAKALKPDVGYGVGVRWSSPVGALNLDIAHGVQAPEPWRIHFFAGISFQ